MAGSNSKLFSITTVIFAVLGLLFFALSITSLAKYKGQKMRVHHMEQKILAGKAEMLKVPEMIGKLRVADKANRDFESQVSDLNESNEELTSELTGLQKENTILTVAKAVLEMDKAGYTKNLVEARQAVEELRQSISTNDGGSFIREDLFIEAISHIHMEVEHAELSEEHAELLDIESGSEGLQSTLNSIHKVLQSSQFMFFSPDERFEELNALITKAEQQSEGQSEINQLIKAFAEKLTSTESTLSEIFASLDEALSKL